MRTPEAVDGATRKFRTPGRWEVWELSEAVGDYLHGLRRANLSKELQTELGVSESTAEKMIGGTYAISGHLLMSLDEWSGGELLRTLRGIPDRDDASRQILEHLNAIKRLAQP